MEEKNRSHPALSSHPFQQLIQRKKRFLIPMTLFIMLFYFGLPLAISLYPTWMGRTIPGVYFSWAWLYAFVQLGMTWFVGWFYWRKAQTFDSLVEKFRNELRDRS